MEKSRLVQRLNPPYADTPDPHSPYAFGAGLQHGGLSTEAANQLGEVFTFDYMGAAQFEWGAVPTALTRIFQQRGEYTQYTLLENEEQPIWVIVRKDQANDANKRIISWATEKINTDLLETTNLYQVMHDEENQGWVPPTRGWLELDNGFFFFTDENMCKRVCILFGIEYGS